MSWPPPDNGFGHVALVVRTSKAGTEEITDALEQLAPLVGRCGSCSSTPRGHPDPPRYTPAGAVRGRGPHAEAIEASDPARRRRATPTSSSTPATSANQLATGCATCSCTSCPGRDASTSSFGCKHGLPLDVDLVLDCRFLPNPHWVDELRPQTGLDAAVREYVLGQPDAAAFLERLDGSSPSCSPPTAGRT
jgi:hypothetical protein